MAHRIRLLPTYILKGELNYLKVRQLPTYILAGEVKRPPKNIDIDEALFGMVLTKAEEPIDFNQYIFSAPRIITDDVKFNTEIDLYPKPDSGWVGKVTFKYNRLPMENLFPLDEVEVEDEKTSYELIEKIVEATQVRIGERDIVETRVQPTHVTIIAAPSSLLFIPGTEAFIPR